MSSTPSEFASFDNHADQKSQYLLRKRKMLRGLEGFQSGLSWLTILLKRPRFREVFRNLIFTDEAKKKMVQGRNRDDWIRYP